MLLNSEEIERRLVGGILRYPDKIHTIRDVVRSEDFADALMRDIWSVMDELAIEGVAIDRAIISRRTHAPSNVTLPVLLAKLQAEAGADIGDYAKEMSDAVMRRKARALFEHGVEMMGKAPNARAALSGLQGEIMQILGTVRSDDARASVVADAIVASAQSPVHIPQLYTGLPFLDDIIGPMRPGNLLVCGGATSSGKSAIAGQIANSIAERALRVDQDGSRLGCPVLYITLEMEAREIVERLLSQETGLSVDNIESGNLNNSEHYLLNDARTKLNERPIYIEDLSRATVSTLVALVMKHQKLHGVGLVIIDHLHYLRGSNRKADRFAQIEEVVVDLKAGAKQTGIPWLALSHLSRDIARRPDKRPHLSDLYGASEIEKSGDVVFFVHRPQYWMDRETKPDEGTERRKEWDSEYAKWADRAEIIVEKRRKGRGVASRKCGFDEKLCLFHTI